MNESIVILLLMALAVIACIAQNWWDKQ